MSPLAADVRAPSGVSLPVWAPEYLVDGQTNLGLPISRQPSRTNCFRSDSSDTPDTPKWVQIDLGREVEVDEVRLIPAHPFDAPNRYGHGFPVLFRLLASRDGDWSHATVVADHTERRFPNPGTTRSCCPWIVNRSVTSVWKPKHFGIRRRAGLRWHWPRCRYTLVVRT